MSERKPIGLSIPYRKKNSKAREWVGLTDEDIEKIWGIHKDDDEHFDITYERDITRAIEAKLREKNT